MNALHRLTSSILCSAGISYQQEDDDLFGEGNDEDDSEGGVHVRPSDLQKQIMSQSIRDLEAQGRVTSGLEVFSISEAAGESARALAAEEKSRRETQMQASNSNKLQAESQRQKRGEEDKKRIEQEQKKQEEEEREQDKKRKGQEQEQREQDKKRIEKEQWEQETREEEQKEQDRRRKEQEQRQNEEIAIQSASAERSRLEQLQKQQIEKTRAIEEKEADDQRQLAASISSERERCEAERLQRVDAQASQTLPKLDPFLDSIALEKNKKAELQRLKREAFLKDMNAFSHAIEEEAGKAALGRNVSENSTICDRYSSGAGNSRTDLKDKFDNLPLPVDFTPQENSGLKKMGVSNSFSDLTSSLFAANRSSDATSDGRKGVGKGTDIWGESTDVPHINSAANVTVNPSGRQKRELAASEYSDRRSGREISEFEDDDEEEDEGMGGATSISNILTKDERMVLSIQQKVAWRALQADLTTRRKGICSVC